MGKDRLEILLCNAIELLLVAYFRTDLLDELGMTLDEYTQVMKKGTETGE